MGKYFYTGDDLEKKMARELSFEGLTEGKKNNDDEGKGEEFIHFLVRNQQNHKKQKKQQIKKSDLLREDLLGQILNDYQAALDHIRADLKEKKNDGNRFIRTQNVYGIKQDMIYSKDSLLGTFGYETHPMESTVPDLDVIDLSNPVHVKALLPMRVEFDPNNDLSFIIFDLEEIIQQVLDKDEILVVEMLRDQLQIKEICEMIDLTYKQTQYKIQKITRKIVNYTGCGAF